MHDELPFVPLEVPQYLEAIYTPEFSVQWMGILLNI